MCEDSRAGDSPLQVGKTSSPTDKSKDDACSPFCSCFCCPSSAFFYNKELQITAPVVLYINRNFSYADQQFISYNMHAIWQPPKLA